MKLVDSIYNNFNYDFLLKVIRILFGLVWMADGSFKFIFNTSSSLAAYITTASLGQPSFLLPWFNFWASIYLINPPIFRILLGSFEIILGLLIILNLYWKLVYPIGLIFSLSIWMIPQRFGGPYGLGTIEVGSGLIYSISFSFLLICMGLSEKLKRISN